jgi:hypothetical protein
MFDFGIATAAKLDHRESHENLTFTRRYLDPNRVTYEVVLRLLFAIPLLKCLQYHTGVADETFQTNQGDSITQGLQGLSERFNLDFEFGTAPRDFYLNRWVL